MDMGIWTSAVLCSVVYCFKCVSLLCAAFALRFHAFGFCGWWLLVVMDSCLVVFPSERESE